MATHTELTGLFGADGVARVPFDEALASGLSEADARTLSEVGVPAELPVVFSMSAPGEPEAFTLVPVDTGEEVVEVLCLGGPADSTGMRFCLDLADGYVILLDLGGDEPSAEIVNTTLADFVEFLYRFALRLVETAEADEPELDRYTAELRGALAARDPLALSDEESWWSMVFDRLLAPTR
ncbi:SUKH-4 family immunity protein [Kitasatospora sp. NA04385]|uniref:SUKH-4 family immunity protein n=1 Tax=Kitasatospora sp. NA04385 TaxID=2742135 RepID=UPI0015910226|nr:SUKH-4 family immunity protein [Kitasatospora sp. NA04385]QKW18294.1 SUKH-4 family immunity protein [Kitasatospora sp. NA04385]